MCILSRSVSVQYLFYCGSTTVYIQVQDVEKSKRKENEEYELMINETKKLIEVLKPHMLVRYLLSYRKSCANHAKLQGSKNDQNAGQILMMPGRWKKF